MAPCQTSEKFVMAQYFHQIIFAQNSTWSRIVIPKKAKKVFGPVSIWIEIGLWIEKHIIDDDSRMLRKVWVYRVAQKKGLCL